MATAVLVGGAGVVAASAVPASAEDPSVVVSPDHVVDGQDVGMDISGFPFGYNVLVECSASVLEPGVPTASRCTVRQFLAIPGLPPAHVTFTVISGFTSYDGTTTIDCLTEPVGCVAGVVTVSNPSDPASVIAAAYAPITFLPAVTASPDRQLTDGTSVAVHGERVPAGDWSVAQCGRAVLDDPSPAPVAALCAPAAPVSLDATGSFDATVVVHDPLAPAAGPEVPCGSSGCVLVLGSTDTPVAGHAGIAFGPTTLVVDPDTDVVEGSEVQLTVVGAPADAQVHQCVLPLGATLAESRCGGPYDFRLDDWGGGVFGLAVSAIVDVSEPVPADCHVAGCGFALFDGSGLPAGQPAPISFAPAPSLTLSPAEGLVDGQAMTVAGRGLLPGVVYSLQHCRGEVCAGFDRLTPGADGAVDTTFPALQRFTDPAGRNVYCRADCSVVLTGGTVNPLRAPYAMAAGELTAMPSEGLADGQEVAVSGRDLMTTYGGPPLGPFPTGGWAITQCDRAVLDQPSLLGVFLHCATLPPTRPMTVATSTLDTTVAVQAAITKILGGTTDCTTAPGACVLGLVRFEQDASLSTHVVPLTFG